MGYMGGSFRSGNTHRLDVECLIDPMRQAKSAGCAYLGLADLVNLV